MKAVERAWQSFPSFSYDRNAVRLARSQTQECSRKEERTNAMTSKKKRMVSFWKVTKRCGLFFLAIGVIPTILFLMVSSTDNYHMTYTKLIKHFPKMEPDLDMAAMEERMATRRIHFEEACDRLGLDREANDTLHRPNTWEYIIEKRHKLVWCNIFKAAASSWMYNFALLAGYSPKFLDHTKEVLLMLVRRWYHRPSLDEVKEALKDSLSFLVVRHPLERLLSAYRDKFQHAKPRSLHDKLGRKIVRKYRKNPLSYPRYPHFCEFIKYLIDQYEKGHIPDMHWAPITPFCTPCFFRFDIIAHIDTFEEDQNYIIRKAGLEHVLKPQWQNAAKGETSAQVVKTYYSQLTRNQILQLYRIYRYDFELFNYTLDGYLEHGKTVEQSRLASSDSYGSP